MIQKTPQIIGKKPSRGVTVSGRFPQSPSGQLLPDRSEIARSIAAADEVHHWRCAAGFLWNRVRELAGFKCQQFVQRHSQRIDVTAMVNQRTLAKQRLFGTHVSQCSQHVPRRRQVRRWQSALRPKSVIQIFPIPSSNKFAGLMSRWIMPRSCAKVESLGGLDPQSSDGLPATARLR